MSDFRDITVEALVADVRARRVSARELAESSLAAIAAGDDAVGAFVAVDGDAALAAAAEVDRRLAAGEEVGPLPGIPIAVKDLEDAAGYVTTHGSAAHAGDPPATADSTLVARLKAAGCVVVGKTNTPEFGWKGDTENRVFGATKNPWNTAMSSGGSSGGTGAAVAAGFVPLGTGSDGGGSIRIPSTVNGLSGMKASLGRVPGGPDAPGWMELSTKGPMARRIRDVALALDAVVGPDPTDLRSLPHPGVSFRAALDHVTVPERVLWCPTLGYARIDREVLATCEAAVRALEAAGTEVIPLASLWPADPARDWMAMAVTYNLRSLGHLRGTPLWEQLDQRLVALMEQSAATVSAVRLVEAEDACHTLNLALEAALTQAPLLLCPTVAGQTGPVGGQGTIDGVQEIAWVSMTYGFNMTRSPAGTVTAGFSAAGMPIGLQVVGRKHADVEVLRAVAALEDLLDVDTRCRFGEG